MTKFFVALSGIVFVMTSYEYGQFSWMGLSRSVAARWGALVVEPGVIHPLQYLSANFVHIGFVHLLLNMMMLWQFGSVLEPMMRGARLAVLFLVTGIAGFITSDVYYSVTETATLTSGASAGVAGLIGGYMGLAYARGSPAWKRLLVTVVLYAVLFAVAVPVSINHAAHIGGLLAGGALGVAFVRQRPRAAWWSVIYGYAAWFLVPLALTSIAIARITGP
jgi:membrane associated rhomboid family serine protease